MIEKCNEDIFDEADALFRAGHSERAALRMTEVVAGHTDREVRQRAARLFRCYAGIEERPANERGSAAVEAAPARIVHAPSPPFVNRLPIPPARLSPSEPSRKSQVDRNQLILDLRQKRERRLQDVSIPPDAALPTPFVPHVIRYLQLTHGRSYELPPALVQALRGIESAVSQLPPQSTQVAVSDLLRWTWEQFPQTAEGSDVFAALVTVFFANDFLSAERAQELTALSPNLATQGRTIRELLESEE